MRLYQALLHVFPASFRAEYGAEMCTIFERRVRGASPLMVVLIWLGELVDVLINAVHVHLDILRQDLSYTGRTLRRSPGFALTAVTVAALGIGATTAAFTMVDHVLIRPLPFPGPDRLVKMYEDHSFSSGRSGAFWDMSPANYRDWKRMSTSFESMACYRGLSVNLGGQGEPRLLTGASFTFEMLPMLGVKPILGRFFTAEDDREAASPTLLLSYRVWQREFGGDAAILGRKVLLDNAPHTVIGVMPADFYFPSRDTQIWTAMRFGPQDFEDRTNSYIYSIARLKPGASLDGARAEMRTITGQLERSYPKELAHVGATVTLLSDEISDQAKLMLMVLLAAAACVLLVACTNLAGLLLARAMVRKKELAVRTAMGAGRERLVRQMLTESIVLALAGGVIGVFIAVGAIPLLVRLVPVYLPIAEVPPMDSRVLLFALLLTVATGIGFGAVPALRACRGTDGLRETARAGGGRREKLRSALVVAEITGSIVLLVSCGLLIRAMWRIQAVHPGFRAENVLTLRTSLPMPKYEKTTTQQQFVDRVISQAKQLPQVTSAAYTSFLPMVHRGGVWSVEVEGHPVDVASRKTASARYVTPGFFSALQIPLLQGRDVRDSDTAETPIVAVVSASFVRQYWPDENPIGRRFNFGNRDRIIAGVVGDVRVRGLERTSEPQVYLPYRQFGGMSTWYAPKDLVVRSSGDPSALASALRRIIREADPEQPVSNVRTLTDIVDAETAGRRVQVSVLGSFALIAFLLAAIGIHGLLSFAVSNRTQEIGVRMALGASSRDIVELILRDGVMLALAGTVFGTALAYAAGQALQALLAGVKPGDMLTYVSAVSLCLVMTLAGSLMPALRAVRIDPTTAIRTE